LAKRKTIALLEAEALADLGDIPAKLAAIRSELEDEYLQGHSKPWIVAFSGGKDSTLLLHLVFEMLLGLDPEKRARRVHVVGNDTLVESPLVIRQLKASMEKVRDAIGRLGLPMTTKITRPCIDQTFWVNLIGRGYIPPTRSFRWCTDRMKILPTSAYIRKMASASRGAILLVGTRKDESAHRRRNMERRGIPGRRLNPHGDISGCEIFSPIAEINTEELWHVLLQARPPWGGSYRDMVTLYRNARGGECPVVLSKDDAPSCGSTSPRFGCWTCTVVQKDRSMEGLIGSGFEEFEPLLDFREWLVALREDNANRTPERRSGKVQFRDDGSLVMGPFRLDVRRRILARLREIEQETGMALLSAVELDLIREIWRIDSAREEDAACLLAPLNLAAG